MSVSQAKRTAIDAYRLRNLQKFSAYSLAYYYRKRALIPQEQLKTVDRPKKPQRSQSSGEAEVALVSKSPPK
jgi:hypothetical protein